MRVIVSSGDPVLTVIYPKEKAIEYFGEEYLEDCGIELPDELVDRYVKNYQEMLDIHDEIDNLLKEK